MFQLDYYIIATHMEWHEALFHFSYYLWMDSIFHFIMIMEVFCVSKNDNIILNVDFYESVLDKSCLWHRRSFPYKQEMYHEALMGWDIGIFDLKSDDVCKSCLLGKIIKLLFIGSFERGMDLLDLIHMDVRSPFRSTTRYSVQYFVSFTDDLNRYGYINLIKHKSNFLKFSKIFKTKWRLSQ